MWLIGSTYRVHAAGVDSLELVQVVLLGSGGDFGIGWDSIDDLEQDSLGCQYRSHG